MTRIGRYLFATTLLVAVIASSGASTAAEVRIVCTNSALADFTANIVNDSVDVEYIMPAGACPSHFDTRPSDIDLIAGADIVVSLGWEPWMDDLLEASENDDAFQVQCPGLGEWNVPSGAKAYVDRIAGGLRDTGLFDNASINTSATAYKAGIDAMAEDLRALVRANGQVGTKVIVMQWQKAFVEWLGYNATATYGPPEDLSTEDMLRIAEAADDRDVAAIVDNLQSGTDFGSNVAAESRAIHVILTNFPGAVPGTDTYLDMIEYNTKRLIDGVQMHENKKGEIADLENQVADLETQRMALGAAVGVLVLLVVVLAVMYKRK